MVPQIINEWINEGIELNPPASEDQIIQCENKIQFSFPEDFKRFYRICNGFKDWVMDSKLLSLWSLERIVLDYPGSNFIPFSDFLINSNQIGFSKIQKGVVRDYAENNFICDTFEQFINHWMIESGEYM